MNFETAPVHPVALSPDGRTLAVCNLPDGRVELFDVSSGVPVPAANIPVGLDPVSLRFRTTNELWVLNHISRTCNIVDVLRRRVMDTIPTRDGPADVAFAGSPLRAFISCAKENTVQVFDPVTRQVLTNLVIDAERPKAMALSPDGSKLYLAIFESGNRSTILVGTQPDTDKILKYPGGPYRGQFPVPNDGTNLRPPMNLGLFGSESQLPDSLIVKKNLYGRWRDDNGGDWTEFISGTNAALSGRIPGWDLPDHDLAVIDTATLDIAYVSGLMNICMDVAANPVSGRIAVIGTDAMNERRFEPNLRGTFVRVELALIDPGTRAPTILDLNPHLDYSTPTVEREVRDLSLGDPRGIVWNRAGTRGYVTGMGSRNLVVIDAAGRRVGREPIELGEGPSGMALDELRQQLYILNRFSATLSVLDTSRLKVVTNVAFFDPTPAAIKLGRKHLYDTRRNSGLGQASCASCHVDARFDRLAWDLGNPQAGLSFFPGEGETFHPMKGPLVTQTLQDIIVPPELAGILPLHWRGDRPNIESFNVAFTDLLARDVMPAANEMKELRDFLSTIYFPPSRFRNLDNSFPENLPLPGLFGVDANGVPDRTPLPDGDAASGHDRFLNQGLNGRFPLTEGTCATCHNRQSGRGVEGDFTLFERENGRVFKAAQLRSIADKIGMDLQSTNSRAGFGFRFDGREDTLTSLFADVFRMTDNQAIADLTAYLLAFPGFLVFSQSLDSHAAVGTQFSVLGPEGHPLLEQVLPMASLSEGYTLDLVARGVKDGLNRGWHLTNGVFQSDRNDEQQTLDELLALATPDTPLTFTVLPAGTGHRLSVDRDDDGIYDRSELDYGFDPSDPLSVPNRPPRFETLPEPYSFVHPGMTLGLMFGASDPDLPTQTLTFRLDPGAPAGASIDPTSGLFLWTPTLDDSDNTYEIQVRVVDDGVPPLSVTTAFQLQVVTLRMTEFHWNQPDGTTWIVTSSTAGRTVAGRSYRLQYKTQLESPAWTDVGDPVASSGFEVTLTDPTGTGDTQRFYRVVLAE